MNEFPFKTLNEAKEKFAELSETVIGLTSKAAEFDALSTANTDLTSQLAALVSAKTELESKFSALNVENVATITAKDAEIATLSSTNAALESKIADLEKGKKSTKAMARELVAASSAANPAAGVDSSEVEPEGKDLMKAMRDEKDPQKLYALYELFKRQSAAK
jgi:hypothetical protein